MSNFNWQTEDDNDNWEEDVPMVRETPEPRKRPWLIILFILGAMVMAGAVVYRQVNTQLTETAQTIEEEVLATHRFVLSAVASQDAELFYAQLSGRDPNWTRTQDLLMTEGLWFNPTAFGLYQPSGFSPDTGQAISVTLSPDLVAAEVIATYPYTIQLTADLTDTIYLQQTAVYRRSNNQRWLLSPPLDDFWGGYATINTQYLTLNFPVRDQIWAEKLAFDLDALLHRACRIMPDMNCSGFLHVNLHLSTEPAVLLNIATPANLLQGVRHSEGLSFHTSLGLPTFTLVGLPVDEAGYEALYRGYGAQMMTAVITRWVGYECCEQGAMYQALLDKQMSDLDLRPWPMKTADYDYLLTSGFNGRVVASLFQRPLRRTAGQNWQYLYALVAFLSESLPVGELQKLMVIHPTYNQWLTAIWGETGYAQAFLQQWRQYVYDHTASGLLSAPPHPLPEQDLLVVCEDLTSGADGVQRYDLKTEIWTTEFVRDSQEGNLFTDISILPYANGYLLQEVRSPQSPSTDQPASRFLWWKEGQEIVIQNPFEHTEQFSFWGTGGVNGRYLFFGMFSSDDIPQTARLDLESCTPANCTLQANPWYYAFWSPDGRYTLTMTPADDPDGPQQLQFYLGDEQGNPIREIGIGPQAFWLNNEVYGYARMDEANQIEFVVGHVTGGQQVPFTFADLFPYLPADIQATETADSIRILYIQASPSIPEQILVTLARDPVSGPLSWHLLVNLDPSTLQLQEVSFLSQTNEWGSISVSPNGRWIALDQSDNQTQLLNLETSQTQKFPRAASQTGLNWSPDGEWLIRSYPDYYLLTSPTSGYYRLIPQQSQSCTTLSWVADSDD